MKAEITKDGKLAIIPESFTEDYALTNWIENEYNKCVGDVDTKTATADVVIYLESIQPVFKLNILPIDTEDKNSIMSSVHETAKDLHEAGLMDNGTMQEFDKLCTDATA
jgi:hypothetical protein